MFPRIEYLHWIEGRTDAVAHDLGSSDLRGSGPIQSGPVPDALAEIPDPPDEVDLAGQVAEEYGVGRDAVLLTAGASMANFVAVGAALTLAGERATDDGGAAGSTEGAPRTRVLVEKPGYEPLKAVPRALGARVERFRRPADEGYPLDPDRVAGAVGEDTALTVVTNRHNPSGRLTDRPTLRDAAGAARATGGYLLVDEVYAPFVTEADGSRDRATAPGGDDAPTGQPDGGSGAGLAFGGPTVAGVEGAVATGSLTKFHGLGGLRVGWIVGDPAFVEAARTVAAHVPALSTPGRALGRRALSDRDRLAADARDLLRENAELLAEFVADRPDLSGPVFEGSTYGFLAHAEADGDAVAEAALDRDLLVVPGRFFEAPDRFRVSLGRDPDHVAAALEVLGETLDAI